jgi:hypothetical protein
LFASAKAKKDKLWICSGLALESCASKSNYLSMAVFFSFDIVQTSALAIGQPPHRGVGLACLGDANGL